MKNKYFINPQKEISIFKSELQMICKLMDYKMKISNH